MPNCPNSFDRIYNRGIKKSPWRETESSDDIKYFPVFCKSIQLTAKNPKIGSVKHCICKSFTADKITSLSEVMVLIRSFAKIYKMIEDKTKKILPIITVSQKAFLTLIYRYKRITVFCSSYIQ